MGERKPLLTRVGNFRQKNYSVEDGIDGTIGSLWRNSSCSVEQKTLGIPFQIMPQRRKKLGILYHGMKIEANSRNSVPNHSAEENQLGIPFRGTEKEANSRNPFPKHISDKNTLPILFAEAGFFVKPILFMSFRSALSCGIDSSTNLGMTTYFHGITENILSLFRGIFSEQNSVANPNIGRQPTNQ